MLIRVRNNTGLWRVEINTTTPINGHTITIQDVVQAIQQYRPNLIYTKPLSFDVTCNKPIDTIQSLQEQNIIHGTMIYCMVDPTTTLDTRSHPSSTTTPSTETAQNSQEGSVPTTSRTSNTNNTNATNMRRIIDKDGTIKLVPTNDETILTKKVDNGFRKGLLPLRDMKMHWTCT
jgi:nuclear protein localization protein 4 homolog